MEGGGGVLEKSQRGGDFFYPFLPYIALIFMFASQMALLGFYLDSSLVTSP